MTTQQLLEAVRQWAGELYPGRPVVEIRVRLYGLGDVKLPVESMVSTASAVVGADQVEERDSGGRRHSQCADDILAVLDAAKRPLTTTRLMSELSRAGKEWSQRHVARYLAEMVADGTLENDPNARPRGYRLPEWEEK